MESVWDSIPAIVTLTNLPTTYCAQCDAVETHGECPNNCPVKVLPAEVRIVDMVDMLSQELTSIRRDLQILSNVLFTELQTMNS